MRALPAHVAVDHNHKRFDNEFAKTSPQHYLTNVISSLSHYFSCVHAGPSKQIQRNEAYG